jgi:hypothetical protein
MKRIVYCLLFLLTLLVPAYLIDGYLGNRYKSLENVNSNWVHNKKGMDLDYAAMGSSRVKIGFDVRLIDSLIQKKGINIGDRGIGIPEEFVLTEWFLSRNKVDYFILEIDYFSLNSVDVAYPFHEYRFFPYFKEPLVDSVIRKNTSSIRYYLWKYVPLVKYIEYNTEYTGKLFFPEALPFDDKGFIPLDKNEDAGTANTFELMEKEKDKKKEKTVKQRFGSFSYTLTDSVYLDNIIKKARANGAQVILYTSPEYFKDPEYRKNVVPDMIRFYNNLSAAYNVPYFHFFDTEFARTRSNISGDGYHLTYKSIDQYSAMLADSLKHYMK